ncbi:MAG: phosphatase PAP2 family protein [Chthoniobacterales bacterium]|nr:phosphatase PAP2 family protein [Chthoniobacterales bacterium]
MTGYRIPGAVWTLGLCVALVALGVAGFAAWDQPTLEAIRAGAGAGFKGLARALSRYGDFPWLLGGGLVALAFCLVSKRRPWTKIVTAMLLAGVIAGLASNVVKLAAGRVRPRAESVEHGWYGPIHQGEWVSLRHDFQSFPSSHAACAFGCFFPLFLSRRSWGAAGLVAAAAIAWSRVQLNAHHVSDVAAGALLGVLVGWIIWRWIVQRGGLSRWLGPSDA